MRHFLDKSRLHHFISVSIHALLVVFFFAHPLMAVDVQSSGIGQGYQTEETGVVTGALMSLRIGKAGYVEFANTDRAEQLIGVVGDKPLIELSDSEHTIQVVTSGVTEVLVSDLEGDIKTGDKIATSPIDGIGMKTTGSAMIVGTAQANLGSVTTSEHFITDIDGKVHTINVGLIPVQIDVSFYTTTGERSAFLPEFLQDLANSVAGKQVSAVRVVIALIIMLVGFISVAILLYASVRSSIISIGRNPLSERSVRKGLLQIGGIVIGILLFTLITLYLVLTT